MQTLCKALLIFLVFSNLPMGLTESVNERQDSVQFLDLSVQGDNGTTPKPSLLQPPEDPWPEPWQIVPQYFDIEYVTPAEGRVNGAASGDLDGDSYPEIALCTGDAAHDGNVTVIEYDPGLGNFSVVAHWVLGQPETVADIDIGDADNDGELEIVAIDRSNKVTVYYYESTSSSYGVEKRFDANIGYTSVEIGDVDNDGKNEILIAGGATYIYRYSPATGNYEKFYNSTTPGEFFPNVANAAIVDWDGDNENEVGVLEEGAKSNITFYNLANNNSVTEEYSYALNDGNQPWRGQKIAIGNVDGDAADEICVLSPHNDSYIFDYNAGALQLKYHLQTKYTDDFGVAAVADVDNDGDSEFLAGSYLIDHHDDDFRWKQFMNTAEDGPSLVGDFDKDGKNEFIGTYAYSVTVEISPGSFTSYWYMCVLEIDFDLYNYKDVIPPAIFHVTTQSSDNQVTINWETDDNTTGYADWVDVIIPMNGTHVASVNATHGTSHTVTVTELVPEQLYTYELHSRGEAGMRMQGYHGNFVTTKSGMTNSPPVVTLTAPMGGSISGSQTFTWTASDADNEPLRYAIEAEFPLETGERAQYRIASEINDTSFPFDTRALPNGENYTFTVYAFDGHDWAYDVSSTPITVNNPGVTNHPPWLSITSPLAGNWVSGSEALLSWDMLDVDRDVTTLNVEIKRVNTDIWEPIDLMAADPQTTSRVFLNTLSYQNGLYQLRVTVSDGEYTHTTVGEVWRLANEANNRDPIVTWHEPTASTPVKAGDTIAVNVSVIDPDMDLALVALYYRTDEQERVHVEHQNTSSLVTTFTVPANLTGQTLYLVAQGYDYFTSVWIDSVPFDLEGGDDGGDGDSETGITPITGGAVIAAFIGLAGITIRRRRR